MDQDISNRSAAGNWFEPCWNPIHAPAVAARTMTAFACPAAVTVAERVQTPDGWAGTAGKAEHVLLFLRH
jgi:hypothetical protein